MSIRHIINPILTHAKTLAFPISVNHHIAVTNDEEGVAAILVTALQRLGYRAELVKNIPNHCDVVIILEGLKSFTSVDEQIALNKKVFQYARETAKRFTHKKGYFIVVQDTGGQFGFSPTREQNAWIGGLAGLVKTAAIEWPRSVCRIIDIECNNIAKENIAERLLTEILSGDNTIETGLTAQGERYSLDVTSQELPAGQQIRLDNNAVIVVTGGGRGITAECIIRLAERRPARFVLLGRTVLADELLVYYECKTETELNQVIFAEAQQQEEKLNPLQVKQKSAQILAVREIKQTIARLQKCGAEALYFDVDILDKEALNSVLTKVRQQFGKISAVIHGAGVLADKRIEQLTDEQFNRVFDTKVYALRNILELTQSDAISLLCLFSSVAGRYGNEGQAAYSMANEILNKVAQSEARRRGPSCLVKALNWGPWDFGMVSAELKKQFTQRGIHIISVAEGVGLFVNELMDQQQSAVEVIYGGKLQSVNPVKFKVTAQDYPYIRDHKIKNKYILPACLVLSWFFSAAARLQPHYRCIACQNVKVLKGIELQNYPVGSDEFNVEQADLKLHGDEVIMSVVLNDNNQVARYSAELRLAAVAHTVTNKPHSPSLLQEAKSWPCDVHDLYLPENALFHGPSLQVIKELKAWGEDGASATLLSDVKTHQNGIDVTLLDGALQLGGAWTWTKTRKAYVPVTIGEFILHKHFTPGEFYSCEYRSLKITHYGFSGDAYLLDAQSEIVAEFKAVSAIALFREELAHV